MAEYKEPMIFPNGMSYQEVPDTAPEVLRCRIHFKADKFGEWLKQNQNERGYVTVNMMKSKEKGSIYFCKDTWKKPESKLNHPTEDDWDITTHEGQL